MATHLPIVPLPWHALLGYVGALPPTRLVVDAQGRAQYPDEWAYDRKHYRPAGHERYAVVAGKVHLVDEHTGRFLTQAPLWHLRPAPQPVMVDHGFNESFHWLLSDDDRMTFVSGNARLVVRLMPNPYHGGMLEPVTVYKAGTWCMEAESRTVQLADRVGERLSIYRGQVQGSGLPDHFLRRDIS